MTFQAVMPSVVIFAVLAAVSAGISAAVLAFVLTVILASVLAIVLAVEVLSGCEHGIDGSLEVWPAWLGINSPTNESGVCGLRWGSTYAKYGNNTKSDRYGPFFQIQEGSRPSFDGACR